MSKERGRRFKVRVFSPFDERVHTEGKRSANAGPNWRRVGGARVQGEAGEGGRWVSSG